MSDLTDEGTSWKLAERRKARESNRPFAASTNKVWEQSLGLYEKSSPSPSAAGAAPDFPSSSLRCSSSLLCFRPEGAEAAAASGAQHRLMVSIMAILSAASLVDQSSSSPCSAVSARLRAEFIMTARSHPQQSHASQHTSRIHLSRRQNKREVGRVGLFLTLANAAASEVYDVMVGQRVRGAI